MEIYSSLKLDRALLKFPLGLAIGSFDGVHLGHQALFYHLRQTLGSKEATLAALTFSNHPTDILSKNGPVKRIYSTQQKLRMLESIGVDLVFLLPFTKELAQKTYEQFLKEAYEAFPFSFLIFGEGDVIGKNREGVASKVQELGASMGFNAIYLPKQLLNHQTISSGRIRECIQQADFKKAAQLLGRPYSIYAPFYAEEGSDCAGFLDVAGLCLPPEGPYTVNFMPNQQEMKITVDAVNEKIYLKSADNLSTLLGSFIEITFI